MEDECLECGICCKLFLINLTEKEYRSGRFKLQFSELVSAVDFDSFNDAEMCGANIIGQKKDGSCAYLENGRCSIHKNRPKSCKAFFCNSKRKEFGGMIRQINERKAGLSKARAYYNHSA